MRVVLKTGLAIVTMVIILKAGCLRGQAQPPQDPAVRVWDTGKAYTQKGPSWGAFNDKANWKSVPYGATDYKPKGDLMVDNEYFYLFLFTNKEDSISLMTKFGTDGIKPNEIYKVHQDRRGLRNFGHGTMWV